MITLGAARLALFLATGLAFGFALFAPQRRRWLAGLAAAALMANLGWFAVLTAGMFEVPLLALSADALVTAMAMPAIGPAFQARAALLAALLIALAFRLRSRWLIRLLSGAALASLAWTGHAGAAPLPRLLADFAHLLAAGAWIGSVVSLWLGVRGGEPGIAARAAAFARPGAVIVAVLAATGVMGAVGLAGEVPLAQLAAAPWAMLMLAKIILFGAALALAWRHRTRLVPALQSGRTGAASRLGASLAVEAALLLGVLALVAVAGQFDPAGG